MPSLALSIPISEALLQCQNNFPDCLSRSILPTE
jgi:hypothetical protein